MFFKTIKVKPSERAIVTSDGQLQQVLKPGKHHLYTLGKKLDVSIQDLNTLKVIWPGITNALRFERSTVEKYWQVVDTPAGQITIAWHQDLPAQTIIGEGSQAFWRPEKDDIQTYTFSQTEFLLPQEVQNALLLQHEVALPLKKYTINADQKLIIVTHGKLHSIFNEGEYVLYIDERTTLPMITDTRSRLFNAADLIESWVQQQPEIITTYFDCLEASGSELILCSYNGKLQHIVMPGTKRYFWKNAQDPLKSERISLSESLEISEKVLTQLYAIEYEKNSTFKSCVVKAEVPEHHQAVLTVEHQNEIILDAGCHYYWSIHKPVNWHLVDLRMQTCEISGQELLTEDKVTVRVNATCNYHVTDARVWVSRYANPQEYLYKELQFAIRAVIGGKNIDTLLADKQGVDAELASQMKQKSIQGIEIDTIGIKDIILPGEIRQILSKVVEAEKSAQANNIRRREETAATRSLLNTARVMEENPTALRLKELETLEKVTEKIDNISVYGGLDGVLNGLIHIQNPADTKKKK